MRHARTSAFTLVELLVVIGIIAVLISILLPALGRVREQGKTAACLSNLRQIGHALQTYATANNGYLVPGSIMHPGDTVDRDSWATLLVGMRFISAPKQANGWGSESSGASVFRCPAGINRRTNNSSFPATMEDLRGAGFWRNFESESNTQFPGLWIDTWYGINAWFPTDNATSLKNAFDRWPFTQVPGQVTGSIQKLRKYAKIPQSSNVVMIYDGFGPHHQNQRYVNARHGKGKLVNAVFADGHAVSLQSRDIKELNSPGELKGYFADRPHFILRREP